MIYSVRMWWKHFFWSTGHCISSDPPDCFQIGCFDLSLVLVILCLSPQNVGVENKSALGGLLDKGAEKSPSKTRQPRKVDLRARYWAFLFDNLRRAVDEIYVTCESDQSVVECRVSVGIRVAEMQTWMASYVVSKWCHRLWPVEGDFEVTTKLHWSHSSRSLLYVRRTL